jgi:hypothetical protein
MNQINHEQSLPSTHRSRKTTLSFLTQDGKTVESIGAQRESPFIELLGFDGKIRAELRVAGPEQPYLALGDGWRTGVSLGGSYSGDVLPHNDDERYWALQFRDSASVKAMIGMTRNRDDKSLTGEVYIGGSKGTFKAP